MAVFLSPGISTRDVDFSAYVTQQSTCVVGMVGAASKGPIGVRTLCTSVPGFISTFGNPISSDFGALAAINFLKKGNRIWYVRVATDSAAAASAVFDGKRVDNTTTEPSILTVTAKEKGTYGNTFRVVLTSSSGLAAVLSVYRNGVLEETFPASLDNSADNYLGNMTSKWVDFTIDVKAATTVTGADKTLAGGSDGVPTASDTAIIIGTGARGLQAFSNPDECDINILCAPGWAVDTVLSAIVTVVDGRGDSFAILDTTQGADVATASALFDNINSNAAAAYYPWVKIFNSFSGAEEWVPPTTVVAGVFANNDSKGNVWNAPAGLNRAVLNDVLAVETSLTSGDRDTLYQKGVNPIINYKNMGFTVWGQKTLQKTASALDRIGVKRLTLYIKKAVVTSTAYVMFENNDARTWDLWCGMIRPFLKSIKDAGGLYDFKVIMDETTVTPANIDRGEMPGQIFIKPTKASEFIPIDFVLKSTGASFE